MDLSVVVVAFDMARELPRTLATLAADYQRDLPPGFTYEVVVVDNGSPEPVDESVLEGIPGGRLVRVDPAPPSPALAANRGIEAASGEVVGVLIDGARMVSPGMLAAAAKAVGRGSRTIVATLAFHLGDEPQMDAAARGYDQAAEDRLLDSVDWRRNGDLLFTIATLAGSSRRGWFGPMGESNALFMASALWEELGGFAEVFDRPGGGLVNHDLYRRACELPDTELVVLLGEGTFHQFHGGAATGGDADRAELWAEYERIRGRSFHPPDRAPVYVGRMPDEAVEHLVASAQWRKGNGSPFR